VQAHPHRFVTAQLVREPTNEHDPDTVRVDIGGDLVGYIARGRNVELHKLIDELHDAGLPASCRAELTGGHRAQEHVGVTLLLAQPATRSPAGMPFLHCSRFQTVKLPRTGLRSDTLDAMLAAQPRRDDIALLEVDESGQVTVNIAGQRVGELTAKLSQRYAPVISEVLGPGLHPACGVHLSREDDGRPKATLLIQKRQDPSPSTTELGARGWTMPTAAETPPPVRPAEWLPDPQGSHELRYWDGTRWTAHVADRGVQATDQL
jgi:hypothetical protein